MKPHISHETLKTTGFNGFEKYFYARPSKQNKENWKMKNTKQEKLCTRDAISLAGNI